MRVGASSTDHIAVKQAFESEYSDLGINCADIGGLWNDATSSYFDGYGPCADESTTGVVKEEDITLAVILGSVFGGLFALALLALCYMRNKEKSGHPVFSPTMMEEENKLNELH